MNAFKVGQLVKVAPDSDDPYLKEQEGKKGRIVRITQDEGWTNLVVFNGEEEEYIFGDDELVPFQLSMENK